MYEKLPGNEELWRGSMTLGQYVLKLVKEKKIKSDEFQSLLSTYGEKHLRQLYLLEREREKGNGDSVTSSSGSD